MKSSTGQYYIGLDHVRALAIFIVYTWHFIHVGNGHQALPPIFPFSILMEGHTGVGLFMVLSGYLFAKILDGRQILYRQFLWNRVLRLAPILMLVIAIIGIREFAAGRDMVFFGKSILEGLIKPTLPNGGWSITVEFHFYLLLPLLLFLGKKWKYALIMVLMAAVALRIILYQELGQIQTLSYWTIIGRVDQFILGILCFRFRKAISGKHLLVILVLFLFALFYRYFDSLGGFYMNPSYPSPSPIWIYMPTIEGLAYALSIAWYDNSFSHSKGEISRFVALIGTYSYSIYLFHFFIVFQISDFIHTRLVDLSNSYLAMGFSFLTFFVMVPIGYLSYTFIETPFLRLRTRYVTEKTNPALHHLQKNVR